MAETVLIYDSANSAHLTEYLECLIDYEELYLSQYDKKKVIILINSTIEQKVRNLILKNKYLKIEVISNKIQLDFERSKNQFTRAIKEYNFLKNYCKLYKITSIIFLQIDIFQFVLGAFPFYSKLTISGILFKPYIQGINNLKDTSLKKSIRTIRKNLQLRWMLLNKQIRKIYLLNDLTSVMNLNRKFNTNKFKYLVDPIKPREFGNEYNLRKLYNIHSEKKILLHIGGVQKRKNLIRILNAIKMLPQIELDKIALFILGKCNDEKLLLEITSLIELLNKSVEVHFTNEFICLEYIDSSISSADLVFIVYDDFYCSSSIIGNVAKHNKFILATKYGVIGQLADKYQLGITVDPKSTEEISLALSKYLQNRFNFIPNNDFVIKHNYKYFARILLEIDEYND